MPVSVSQKRQWQALLVTEALSRFVDLEGCYTQLPNKTQRERVLCVVARTLAHLHRAGWRHGCLYDKHLFVKESTGNPQIALLDLGKTPARGLPLLAPRIWRRLPDTHCAGMPAEDLALLQAQYQSLLGQTWSLFQAAPLHQGNEPSFKRRSRIACKRWICCAFWSKFCGFSHSVKAAFISGQSASIMANQAVSRFLPL